MQITQQGDVLTLQFEPRGAALAAVRALPARVYDRTSETWRVPHTKENWTAMLSQPAVFPLTGIREPRGTGYSIEVVKGLLRITTPWSAVNTELLRRLPDYRMWDAKKQGWFCKPTRRNLQHLKTSFRSDKMIWSAEALALYQTNVVDLEKQVAGYREQKAQIQQAIPEGDDYKFGGPKPWAHQRRAFYLSRDRKAFALFMEQRTGKSKVVTDTGCWNFINGRIRQALIIAPNSVKTLWVTDELPKHMPEYIPWVAAAWSPNPNRADQERLAEVLDTTGTKFRWLVMNIEALSSEKGVKAAAKFVKGAPTLMVIDESTRIKTPRAKRTMAAIGIGKHAAQRRILTGTPATQGPLDTYAQGLFLDPEILGFGSFYSFRNHFAIMGGWNNKEVVAWAHLDELQALWDAHSFRVTRDECFDIPAKGYQKLVVEMTPEQQRIYTAMATRMKADLGDGQRVTASIVLTQMLRLAQIAGGFVTANRDDYSVGGFTDQWSRQYEVQAIPGGNPKIDALTELVADVQGKVVVWARFRAEISAAAAALRKQYGADSTVEFHGGVSDADRVQARTAFQDPGSSVRFLVGQTEVGGLGLNLDQARTIVYLSNSFSLESRLQSEDRPMSAAQKYSVAVVDIIAKDTVDDHVVTALREKQDVARLVTGDKWQQWL